MAVLGAGIGVAAIAGALHPTLQPLVVFVVAFPILWIGLATTLTYTTARALRMVNVDVPSRIRALSTFRLAFSLTLDNHPFPAIGVLTNVRLAADDVTIDEGPSAEIAILEVGRGATSEWEITAKERGLLLLGPFRAAIELPGSAIRVTAIFERKFGVTVLPAVYHLQPFVDTLLAGRHLATGRFQKVPSAIEEYIGAREYRPGDSPKLIHRVLSLRTNDPNQVYVREFEDPSREDLSIVLDTAEPIDGDVNLHAYRLEKAICFVSALCRIFATRRLTIRFVCQRSKRDMVALRVRPLDIDLDRLDMELARVALIDHHAPVKRILLDEVRRQGAAVIFVSLSSRERIENERLPIVTLTPDHVPVFTREVVA